MFTQEQLKVIEYCAEEVRRQGDGPTNVYDMLNAWEFMIKIRDEFGPEHKLQIGTIAHLGKMVEPTENPNGFRQPLYLWVERKNLRQSLLKETYNIYLMLIMMVDLIYRD
jgi:hypothetical protein